MKRQKNFRFIYDNERFVKVWVDGSCLRNGQPGAKAGYGVFYNWGHFLNVSAPVIGRATNNAGEIQAAIRAIEDCSAENVKRLRIHTDSEFLIKAVTKWMARWSENSFCKYNGNPLANRDDFKKLYNLLNNGNMTIRFKHVSAHSGDKFNDEADRLAKLGAEEYGEDEDEDEDEYEDED